MKKATKWIIWIIIIILLIIFIWQIVDKPNYDAPEKEKPFRGNSDSPITLTEFSDLQCPACRSAHPTVKKILEDYDGIVKWEYKQFPLESIHPYAFHASEASECANDLGEFWLYVDTVFMNQNDLSEKALIKYAEETGLDRQTFSDCLKSRAKSSIVRFEMAEGRELSVSGTPTFFVNGKKVDQNSYDALVSSIESEKIALGIE